MIEQYKQVTPSHSNPDQEKSRSRVSRSKLRLLCTSLILIILSLGVLLEYGIRTSKPPQALLNQHTQPSVRFYDRGGRLLRAIPNKRGHRSLLVPLSQVTPHLIQALLCLEDKSFYQHSGVPMKGVLSAIWTNIKMRRFKMGGSGITQQLIKMYRGRAKTVWSKLREALIAFKLERLQDKDQILETYLNQVSFGGDIIGVEGAAIDYFGVSSSRLSLAQSTYLAAIPYSPTRFNPRRHPKNPIPRQHKAIQCLIQQGEITQREGALAQQLPITLLSVDRPFDAPHLTSSWRSKLIHSFQKKYMNVEHKETQSVDVESLDVVLSIDHRLQERAERALAAHVQSLNDRGVVQGATVALDLRTGEALFWVGSAGFNSSINGQFDRVMSLKQPGSTLKPFLYGLALDRGMSVQETLPDRELYFDTPFGKYRPRNYSGKTQGVVALPYALANSLNIPAVWLLNHIKTHYFLNILRGAGLRELTASPEHYGLGLTLGDGEVSLIHLTNAYRGLARGGQWSPWSVTRTAPHSHPSSVQDLSSPQEHIPFLSPRSAQIISYILSQPSFRAQSFGRGPPLTLSFPTAVKTGTSQGYTNAWTIGFSSHFVVGVWVNGVEGKGMDRMTGASGAAPLWAELMNMLHEDVNPEALPQEHITPHDLAQLQELLSAQNRRAAPLWTHKTAIAITYPPDHAHINFSPHTAPQSRRVRAEAILSPHLDHIFKRSQPNTARSQCTQEHCLRVHWSLDDEIFPTPKKSPLRPWLDLTSGKHKLCVSIAQAPLERACVSFMVSTPPP